jgi:hypothetical protein
MEKRGREMTDGLGVRTADDGTLTTLIDYQSEIFEVIRAEIDADLVESHVGARAKAVKAFDVSIVLSMVDVGSDA